MQSKWYEGRSVRILTSQHGNEDQSLLQKGVISPHMDLEEALDM